MAKKYVVGNDIPLGGQWGNLFPKPPKETKRDTRRNFSETQKGEIWDRQKGKCAGTYCKHAFLLRSAVNYDHIIPWEKGGRTIVSNGQALCPTCHAIKSSKDRLKNVDKNRKSQNKATATWFNPVTGKKEKFDPLKI